MMQRILRMVMGYVTAEQATTSGTTKDFDVTPSAGKVILCLKEVSLDGTEELLVQLGTAAGIVDTGYDSSAIRISSAGAATHANSTAGFILDTGGAADQPLTGSITFTRMNPTTNFWVAQMGFDRNGGAAVSGGGGVDLPGELTTVRLTSTGATPDDFDDGAASLMVEG